MASSFERKMKAQQTAREGSQGIQRQADQGSSYFNSGTSSLGSGASSHETNPTNLPPPKKKKKGAPAAGAAASGELIMTAVTGLATVATTIYAASKGRRR